MKAYDFETLVGNIGGYAGMFLGSALLNLPSFFLGLKNVMKKHLSEMRMYRKVSITKVVVDTNAMADDGKVTTKNDFCSRIP